MICMFNMLPTNLGNLVKYVDFTKEIKHSRVFATNSDFIIHTFFKPNVVDQRYFKL